MFVFILTSASGRRKAQQGCHIATGSKVEVDFPFWSEKQQTVVHLPFTASSKVFGTTIFPGDSLQTASAGVLFPLSSDHLIVLLQYNALRGCLSNRELLSRFEPTSAPHQDCSWAALHVLPGLDASALQSLPPSLQPTLLQRTVSHEPWIDIIPHPQFRDNLIRATGAFNEDELWSDTIGGLFEGFADIEQRGVVLWCNPWNASGWEVSEGFWLKWGWLLRGCFDALETTNQWRAIRGESSLVFDV